jgi:hypothetical protein
MFANDVSKFSIIRVDSESDYFFFPPPKSEYFFQQHWESEYFLEKNHTPPLEVKWPVPYNHWKYMNK